MKVRKRKDGTKLRYVSVWITDPPYAIHEEAAQRAGITMSEHVRRILLKTSGGVSVPVPPGKIQRQIVALIDQLKKLERSFAKKQPGDRKRVAKVGH